MKQPDKKQRFHGMAAIGMGLGLLFGILWENLPLGLLMGAALAGFGNMTTKRQVDDYERTDVSDMLHSGSRQKGIKKPQLDLLHTRRL